MKHRFKPGDEVKFELPVPGLDISATDFGVITQIAEHWVSVELDGVGLEVFFGDHPFAGPLCKLEELTYRSASEPL